MLGAPGENGAKRRRRGDPCRGRSPARTGYRIEYMFEGCQVGDGIGGGGSKGNMSGFGQAVATSVQGGQSSKHRDKKL